MFAPEAEAVTLDKDNFRELIDYGRLLFHAVNAVEWELDPDTEAVKVIFDDGWRGVFEVGEYLVEGDEVFLWPENIFIQAFPVHAVWNILWGHPAAVMGGGGIWWLLGRNSPPVAVDDFLGFTEGDPETSNAATLSFDVLGDDYDPNNDAISLQPFDDVEGTFGRFTMNAAGTDIEYHFLDDINATNLAEGETATDTATYTIIDEHGLTDTATLTVTITGINKAVEDGSEPSAAPVDGDVSEDATSVSLTNLLDNASDADGGTPIVSAVAGGTVGARVDVAAGGYFIIEADGTATYYPDGDFEYLDKGDTTTASIEYTVSDGRGSTTNSTVTVTIFGENDGFSDADESATVNEDDAGQSLGNILSVTDDPDADDSHTITDVGGSGGLSFSPSEGGEVTVTANGAATFDPGSDFDYLAAGETEQIEVTYTVSDSAANGSDRETDTSTLTITVQGRNDAFTDGNETLEISEDATSAGSINILGANGAGSISDDLDTSDSHTIKTFNGQVVPAAGLTLTSPTIAGGTLTVQQNGTVTFNPGGDFHELLGTDGTLTFSYEVTDNASTSPHTDTSTLTITIDAVNDPILDGNESYADTSSLITGENSAIASGPNVLANVTDADDGDSKHVADSSGDALTTAADYSGSQGGTFTLTPTGAMSFDPGTSFDSLPVYDASNATSFTTTQITYTVTDGDSTDTSTVTVQVRGVNDAPVAKADTVYVDADNSVPVSLDSLFSNDTDIDLGTQLTVGSIGHPDSSDSSGYVDYGYFSIPEQTSSPEAPSGVLASFGLWPNYVSGNVITEEDIARSKALKELAVGQTITQQVTYTITDGDGGSDTAVFKAVIQGVNDDPTAIDFSRTLNETNDGSGATTVTFAAMNNADDVDAGTSLSIALGTPSASHGTFALTASGNNITYAFRDDSSLDSLNTGQTAQETVSYTVSDQNGGTVTKTITVTINGLTDNTDPVASNDSLAFTEDTAKTTAFDVLGNDSDVDSGDTITVKPFTTKSGTYGTFSQTPSGDIQYAFADNSAAQQLKKGETATETASYAITDGNGGTDTGTLTVTITGVNDAPVAKSDFAGSATEDAGSKTITFAAVSESTDVDAGTPALTLSTTLTNETSDYGDFSVSGGEVKYVFSDDDEADKLAAGETAKETVTYTINDSNGGSDSETITVTITGVNDAPTLKTPGNDIAIQDNETANSATYLVPKSGGGYEDDPGTDIAQEFEDVDDTTFDIEIELTPDPANSDQNHVPGLGIGTDGALTGTANLADPFEAEKYTVTVTATDDGDADGSNPLSVSDTLDVYIGLNVTAGEVSNNTDYTMNGSDVAEDRIFIEDQEFGHGSNITLNMGDGHNYFRFNRGTGTVEELSANSGTLVYNGGTGIDEFRSTQFAAKNKGNITLNLDEGADVVVFGTNAAENDGIITINAGDGGDNIRFLDGAGASGGTVNVDLGDKSGDADVITFGRTDESDVVHEGVTVYNFNAAEDTLKLVGPELTSTGDLSFAIDTDGDVTITYGGSAGGVDLTLHLEGSFTDTDNNGIPDGFDITHVNGSETIMIA